jgi:putative ABC transport system permease protein
VSTEVQEGLGLKIGDKLTFDVAGETYEATVASVRKVKWDSFQPNFFLVFAPGLLDDTGHLDDQRLLQAGEGRTIAELVRRFPSVSVFDLDELLTQVRSVIDKAILAVQSVFLFTLFAGLMVLLAAVQATRDERRYESAMLRTLGASRGVVFQGVAAEFVVLGALAGLLASAGATAVGYLLARQVFDLQYRPDPWIWVIGVVGGALLVGTAGLLAARSVVSHPPMAALR